MKGNGLYEFDIASINREPMRRSGLGTGLHETATKFLVFFKPDLGYTDVRWRADALAVNYLDFLL